MLNLGDASLNLIRHYKFTFFDISGEGPFTVAPIQNLSFQDLVNFSFTYTITNNVNNTARFIFYNLSRPTIDLFSSTQNRRGFIFDTWYANDTQGNKTIFKGLTYTVNTYRQGTDTITEVVGCDLFLNLQYKGISQSFPVGTTYLSIVQTLLVYYGNIATLNPISNQYLNGIYKTPKTFTGQLVTVLNQIASDAGCIFSIQLNSITFIPSDLDVETSDVTQEINDQNGLVGTPRAEALSVQLFPVTVFTNQNLNKNLSLLTVSTLIRPYFLYDKVYINTEFYTGYYGILGVTQSGEWRGNEWYSTLRLWPDTSRTAT